MRAPSFSFGADPFEGVDDFDSFMFASSDVDPTEIVPTPRSLHSSEVYTPDGRPLPLAKLVAGAASHAVLIFVPRDSVEISGLVYGKVAHLLQQAGVRLVFVSAWTPSQASTFLSRFEKLAPFPGLLVCDPAATLFSQFGFMRSKLGALIPSSRFSAPMRQGVRNALSTVSYRAQNRDIAFTNVPSSRLKCGAVVMEPCAPVTTSSLSQSSTGSEFHLPIIYSSEESTSTGVACYLDVLSACGVHGAFVPEIDVAHLYTRFNTMRATLVKARSADLKEEKVRAQVQRGRRSASRSGSSATRRHTWLGT